ncbi:uncharacterized protein LOC130677574 [Microplitis mediator]|uniref:uncharacterized protein LOC130677574 n=1 Tax=Microplitis mediator TaxID=375433 RepID=UPI0025536E35|nr:uncharacterized protein LOC130677574 [Microplitis mediator]
MATTPPDLDWVQLRIDMGEETHEDFKTRFKRKMFGNPLVPIGMLATTVALLTGLGYLRKGNSVKQQMMMRARVSAQGFTIAAALFGTLSATFASHFEEVANYTKKYTGLGTPTDTDDGTSSNAEVKTSPEPKAKNEGEKKEVSQTKVKLEETKTVDDKKTGK